MEKVRPLCDQPSDQGRLNNGKITVLSNKDFRSASEIKRIGLTSGSVELILVMFVCFLFVCFLTSTSNRE